MQKIQKHCGSCVFLNREKKFEAPCSQLGRIATSRACGSHKSDVFSLVQGNEESVDALKALAEVLGGLPTSSLQTLALMVANEKQTRRKGFKFYQKVYVKIYGFSSNSDYLSHYTCARVLDADKECVRLISESGKISMSFYYDSNGKVHNIYTAAQFKPIREQLIKQKRITDPAQFKVKPKSNGIVPLDWAYERNLIPNDYLDLDRPKEKKKPKGREDLVTIFGRMQKGIIQKRKRSSDEPIVIDWGT